MTPPEDSQVKILFSFYSDLLEQDAMETIWATVVDVTLGYYRISSLPFYVSLIATDDLILAEYDDEEEMLTYKQTIQPSGNSTIWVVMTDDEVDIDEVREFFHDLDCFSDPITEKFFSMEVKASVNYLRIKDELNRLRSEKIIDYAEPCLSVNHQY